MNKRLREPLQRGGRFKLGEYQLGPFLAGAGADSPVCRRVVDDGAAFLHRGQLVFADERRVDVIEEPRSRRAAEADPRAALVTEREDPLAVPGGDEFQRLRVGAREACVLDVRVEVAHVNEARPVAVGACCQCPGHLFLADLSADRDDLALLNVGAEADH